MTSKEFGKILQDKLTSEYGVELSVASNQQIYRSLALICRQMMSENHKKFQSKAIGTGTKQVYYLCMEFLMGRSLKMSLFNLGLNDVAKKALADADISLDTIYEEEPDAGLGNGGLGRLAACYLDSMTTLDIPATGYSICYELGIFKQKIVEGQQVELPDDWKGVGSSWLLPKPDEAQTVHFGGTLREFWHDGHLHIVNENAATVLAVPCDMVVAGYGTGHVNTLRLWDARSTRPVDMALFSRGEYLKAAEDEAMAETIAKVLYPEDNHYEGKSLRLKQQYFFVSATVQSIITRHLETYGTLKNFHEKNVIQINDTHPALVIPELMRLFMDEAGMTWDEAWAITSQSVAYTNHTVLSEALERWPQQLVESLLPRVWQIIQEIAHRWQAKVEDFYHDPAKTEKMAIIWGGEVRMANLCIAGCLSVNGVSGLHSEILKKDVFKDACAMEPWKFTNVTNGIDHRRWLSEINPGLDGLVRDLTGGDDYLLHPQALKKLDGYADDDAVLQRLDEIKQRNKADFADYAKKVQGVTLDPGAIFDVQVKRLHEYKRQLLNVLHIITLYQQLQDDPNCITRPHTFLFGAKAAPGYAVAKRIIHLINSLADDISHDPRCRGRLQVVFLENYRVSLAEHLMPASEVSQQISTAGKEASGTGNMKFMMNGALTVGTLDGANVEMHDMLGDENMFLFGLHADQAAKLRQEGYVPQRYVSHDPQLERCLSALRKGFRDGVSYEDLYQRLISQDEYLLLADYRAYCDAERRMAETYEDRRAWNSMSLHNIARSGIFAADRAVAEYADNIWHVPHR